MPGRAAARTVHTVLAAAVLATLVGVLGGTIPLGEWQGSPYLFVEVDNGRIVSVQEPMLP